MRLALVRPLFRTPQYDPEIQESLALEMLTALLRHRGHQVLLLDPMLTGQTEEVTARRVLAFRPELVGFSAMSSGDLESIRIILDRLRAAGPSPQPITLVGGNLMSTEPETAFRSLPEGVLGIRSEGEGPLLSLLESLEGSGIWEEVPGLVRRLPDGSLAANPLPRPLERLDDLPLAAREFAHHLVTAGKTLNLQGSRGCTGSCHYCTTAGMRHPEAPRWRGRSPEQLAEEIACLVRNYGARTFHFVDDDFLGPPREAATRAEGLADALTRRRLHVAFSIQARPASLTARVQEALAGAGLAYVFLGLESDDPHLLRQWGRPQDPERSWRVIRELRRRQVEVQVGCILFHPEATMDSVRRLARRLRRWNLLNYRTATNRLQALPGSILYGAAREKGLPDSEGSGPYTPPISDPATATLHRALLQALAPLRPVWLEAACVLPHWLTLRRAAREENHPGLSRQGAGPQAILARLNHEIGETLFTLMNSLTRDNFPTASLEKSRRQNFQIAEQAGVELERLGLIPTYELLREAVHQDSGM